MKFNFLFLFIIFSVMLAYSDNTSDTAKDLIIYKNNPTVLFEKVIQNPENYKKNIKLIVDLGMNIFNTKDSGNRQPLYKALVKLYDFMSDVEKDSVRDMCLYLIDSEYRNFNDISASELIILLSLLGNSTGGKIKVNVSEALKKFILHPSIQKQTARHCIDAIIFSFKKFSGDSDASEYITKIYEFSSKWSVQDQRRLKP
ncbi:MAG TPA: hypothetical protein PK771_01590 [Spirochaetota bacterium]|nr:hypothetical protein [Spirochaetota bacterium]